MIKHTTWISKLAPSNFMDTRKWKNDCHIFGQFGSRNSFAFTLELIVFGLLRCLKCRTSSKFDVGLVCAQKTL
jgi:hypothetical protein